MFIVDDDRRKRARITDVEMPTKHDVRVAPVAVMVDLEGENAVKRAPPSEKVVEEVAVGKQLGE
ncbi:MAG: hypothetical protein WBQ44_05295 [Rhodococcus sp. (in: high G+C Gram-positive bacteria)]